MEDSVRDDELLARFVLNRRHVRPNNSVKPDVFIPYPHQDLSVTRHGDLDEGALWTSVEVVAVVRRLALVGRADIDTGAVRSLDLKVEPDPLPENPSHTVIAGWPNEKSDQKVLAIRLAETCVYVARP